MTAEQNEILDELLSLWHHWAESKRLTRGYDRESSGAGQYRSSRQYDDQNGKLDDDLDKFRCEAVDHEVEEMVHPYRTAIFIIARNLYTGCTVWNSPRLPRGGAELREVEQKARLILAQRLVDAGVICSQ